MTTMSVEAAGKNHPAQMPVERSDYYKQVLSFVISNAWMGENMAIENYSQMVPMMPTVDSKIEVVGQAKEEAKHVLMLEKLARKIGFEVDTGMVEDEWQQVRDSFDEAVEKGDLAACLIIQDLMVESLAIGLYSTFASPDNKDHRTAKVAAGLLADELKHLDFGIKRIQDLMEADSDAVHDSLVWAHNRVMPALFEMVHNACDFLCERKDVPCKSHLAFVENAVLYLKGQRSGTSYIDLDRLKVASLESYIDMLDKAQFKTSTVNQLVASMAAYDVPGRDTGIADVLTRA